MTCRLDVVARVELDHLDRAVGRAHAAADRAALERRPGRRRGGQDAVAVAEHDLAVGADVDEQPGPLVAVHAGGEHAGDDVAADVRAEGREAATARARGCSVEPEVGGEQPAAARGGHHERRDAERLGVDAERQRGHRGVAGERDLVDLARVDPGLGADLARSSSASVCVRERRGAGRSASGSIIVALIRVITSPPNGCCLLSIEATATGVPVARSSRVATTVVVPRSKAIA